MGFLTLTLTITYSKSMDFLTLGAFVLIVILGGSNAVAIRFSNAELPPFWGAAIRFIPAALFYWIVVFARRIRLPRGPALIGVLLFGILNFGAAYAFFYWGMTKIQAGLAQVVIALVPLMTFFFARIHGLEPFRWRGLFGAILAAGGIALAFSRQSYTGVPLMSLFSLIVGSACVAESLIAVKGFPASHPLVTNAIAMSTGVVVLLSVSLTAHESWHLPVLTKTWGAVLYLVIVGSVMMFYLFVFVVRRWTASATSYQFVLLPFVTVVVSAWLAGERVTPGFALGSVLVLTGVWIGAVGQLARKTAGKTMSSGNA